MGRFLFYFETGSRNVTLAGLELYIYMYRPTGLKLAAILLSLPTTLGLQVCMTIPGSSSPFLMRIPISQLSKSCLLRRPSLKSRGAHNPYSTLVTATRSPQQHSPNRFVFTSAWLIIIAQPPPPSSLPPVLNSRSLGQGSHLSQVTMQARS